MKSSKKAYSVNVHFDCVVSIDVAAENEEDAIEQALNIAESEDIENLDPDYFYTEACITSGD